MITNQLQNDQRYGQLIFKKMFEEEIESFNAVGNEIFKQTKQFKIRVAMELYCVI